MLPAEEPGIFNIYFFIARNHIDAYVTLSITLVNPGDDVRGRGKERV